MQTQTEGPLRARVRGPRACRRAGCGAWLMALVAAGCGGAAVPSGAMGGPGTVAAPVEGPRYTFSTGSFAVAPGTELTQCYYAPAPVDEDIAVVRFEARMRPGSHHFNFFYLPPSPTHPTEGLGDCTEAARIELAGSQWDSIDQALPDGTALKIPRGSWLALESHFVNATPSDAMGGVDVTVHTVPASAVHDWVGIYFNLMRNIRVPPNTKQVLRGRCDTYFDTNVFTLTSHMHHFGSVFEINLWDADTGTSTNVYSSNDFEHPKIDNRYLQPLHIGPNQRFEWKCHYDNNRPTTLAGGDSARDNEMCIMAAFYYPSMSDVPYCFADAVVDSSGP